MFTVEATTPTPNGLDYAIKAEDNRIIAWAYSMDIALTIADCLTHFNRKCDGSPACSGCDKERNK